MFSVYELIESLLLGLGTGALILCFALQKKIQKIEREFALFKLKMLQYMLSSIETDKRVDDDDVSKKTHPQKEGE